MAVELATAYISLVPSFKGVEAALASGLGGPAALAGDKAGADASGRFASKFGSGLGGLGKVVAAAVPVAAVAAIGVAAFKIGADFDEASDKIRVATGATGKDLDSLNGTFKSTFASIPTTMGAASDAVSQLRQRLGLTGQPLGDLSKQVLELSRVTKTDLGTNIEASSAVLTNWGVKVKDQGARLDELFRTSQATGVGVAELAQAMAKTGSPLRQAGLNFEQSAALLGLFSKAGIEVGAIMPALSKSIAKAAKDGKSAGQVFQDTFNAIRKAPTDTAAAAAAIDVFGARAGPNLAGLIRQGKLSYQDLAKTIASGKDTIVGAAKDTNDLSENWQIFKNKALVAIEPVASRVFSGLSSGMVALTALADRLAPAFSQLFDSLFKGDFHGGGPFSEDSKLISVIFDIRDALGFASDAVKLFIGSFTGKGADVDLGGATNSIIQFGATARQVFDALQPLFDFIQANLKPILIGLGIAVALLISPFFTLGAALVFAYIRFKPFRDVVNATLQGIVAGIGFLVDQTTAFVDFWVRIWPQVSEAVGHVIVAIRDIVTPFLLALRFLWRAVGDDILNIVQRVFNAILGVIDGVLTVIRGIIQTVLALINGDWGKAWDGIRLIFAGFWDAMFALVAGQLGIIVSLLGAAWSIIAGTVRNAWSGILNFIKDILAQLVGQVTGVAGLILTGWRIGWETIRDVALGQLRSVIDAIEGIVGTVTGLGGRLARAAVGMWDGLRSAFREAINWIIDHWNALEFKLPSFKAFGVEVGGFTLGVPDIQPLPSFDIGGIVPGPIGAPQLAVVHGGEFITPVGQSLAQRAGIVVENLHVVEPGATADEIVDNMGRRLGWHLSVAARVS